MGLFIISMLLEKMLELCLCVNPQLFVCVCVCVASSAAARTKSNLLSLSSEELNTSLSQFVREVCRPNGERYSPDSVLYLCLGIQQVSTESGTYLKGQNVNTAAVECEGKLTSNEA